MKAVVESRRLLLDDFFKVEEAYVSVELHKGGMSPPLRRLDLKRKDAAAALVVNKARGTVILVRQFRYAALARGNAWMTEIVAGLIDGDEAPEAAARREILEETGYAVGRLEPMTTFYPTPGITSERIVLYYAETQGETPQAQGGGLAEENEDIEVLEVPFADAFAMVDQGEIVDGKTLIALLWLRVALAKAG